MARFVLGGGPDLILWHVKPECSSEELGDRPEEYPYLGSFSFYSEALRAIDLPRNSVCTQL
jgi:hypothetical protein